MARRPYVHLGGTWPRGFVPAPGTLRKLDQFSSELVNGADGGSWAPLSPIVVGPAAAEPTIVLGSGSELSGDLETVRGNSAEPADDAGIILTGGAPPFEIGRSRSVIVPFSIFAETTALGIDPTFEIDPVTLGCRRLTRDLSMPIEAPGIAIPFPVRAQHRNATILGVQFFFRVTQPRAVLPAIMPRFRVARVSPSAVAPLHSATGGYDANGWLTDTAATTAAYYANGQTRSISYTPDQNHTALDPGGGFFLIQIRDENGADSKTGNVYFSARVFLSAIADLRQE